MLLPGYLSFSEAQRAFREGRTLDGVLWMAAGAAEIGLLVYTFGASSAVFASARGGAVAVNQAARGVDITEHGLAHTLARYTIGGARTAGKSVFNIAEDIAALVRNASGV